MDDSQPAPVTHLGAALEDEHHAIDAGIENFLAGRGGPASARQGLRDAITCLRRHIYLEETFLFPPLRAGALMAPVFVMLTEHGELWRILDSLEGLLDDDGTPESQRDTCVTLLTLLERHNTKEEPVIYPHADTTLSEDARAELSDYLQHEEMPSGWVCQAAGQA